MQLAPFRIDDLYDLSRPAFSDSAALERELHAVEDAAVLGPLPVHRLRGLSEAALREFLRMSLLRVRTRGELDRVRARYAELGAYFPGPRRAQRAA